MESSQEQLSRRDPPAQHCMHVNLKQEADGLDHLHLGASLSAVEAPNADRSILFLFQITIWSSCSDSGPGMVVLPCTLLTSFRRLVAEACEKSRKTQAHILNLPIENKSKGSGKTGSSIADSIAIGPRESNSPVISRGSTLAANCSTGT